LNFRARGIVNPDAAKKLKGDLLIMFGFFGSLLGLLFWLVVIIFDIIAISNILRSRQDNATKIVLILLILFFPIIGAGVYLLVFRDKGY
jgi:hypothetical protein